MKKTIFIVGKQSTLLEQLTRIYLESGCIVAVTSGNSDACLSPENETKNLLRLNLNRRSPLSNRSCLINTLSAFETIDEAIILNIAEGDSRPIHELPSTDIEEPIDSSIKGVFYVLKEIISYFWKHKRGILSMVNYTYGSDVLTPIDAATDGSFRAITESLFTYYKNEHIVINGFESQSAQVEEFAVFIKHMIDEKSSRSNGRWFRHSDRGGLLSNLPIPGFKK